MRKNNKLIKGVSDVGLDGILNLLVLSFNNYYSYRFNKQDILIHRNDFEISEVLYSNSDMNDRYNLHLSINMLNNDINVPQIHEIIIVTDSNLLEATCKMHFNHPQADDDYYCFMFAIREIDDWFTYY